MTTTEWSTASVEPKERFDFWREAVCDAFLDLRAECSRRAAFEGRIVVERRRRLEIARIDSSGQRVTRRPSHDGGWCYLNLQIRGVGFSSQGGETVRTGPGDAVMVRTDRPFDFSFDGPFTQYSIRLPEALNPLVDRPIALSAHSTGGAALRSLVALSPIGGAEAGPDDPAVDEWLDRAIVDLARTALLDQGRRRDARPDRDDPWPLIDADIEANLHDPTLNPRSTAARVGMSLRSLHQAFDSRPLTFSREVRHRRLVLANTMLADPRFDRLRIRDIAADCGFTDVSHFQRIYRRQFGLTPGQTRTSR